jgi:hypothetical protein
MYCLSSSFRLGYPHPIYARAIKLKLNSNLYRNFLFRQDFTIPYQDSTKKKAPVSRGQPSQTPFISEGIVGIIAHNDVITF